MMARPPNPASSRGFLLRNALSAALAVCVCCTIAAGQALPSLLTPPTRESKREKRRQEALKKSGIQAAISIPVEPLGFAPPARFYLGDRVSQASLDFLDEQTILFTFRVPSLMVRDHAASHTVDAKLTHLDDDRADRTIRAVVLTLPTGKVAAEALWRLHDLAPYLIPFNNGRFLLRDGNLLQTGDAALHLEPYLRFPGLLKHIEIDPEQKLLVAESIEAPAAEKVSASTTEGGLGSGAPDSAPADTPGTMAAGSAAAVPPPEPSSQRLLRIMRMDDHKVLLFTRLGQGFIHLPLDGEGYYDAERGNGQRWLVRYRNFTGSDEPLISVESSCYPALDVMAPGVVLASACNEMGGRKLTMLTRQKQRLWEASISPYSVWPVLTVAAAAPRMARVTLDVSHPVGPASPLDDEDIHGQTVQVYDVATGKVVLTGPASPILDAGGNFALSPSGRRFAVLNEGNIQVFDLPPVPAIPHP